MTTRERCVFEEEEEVKISPKETIQKAVVKEDKGRRRG